MKWSKHILRSAIVSAMFVGASTATPPAFAINEEDITLATFDPGTLTSCQNYCFIDVCVFIDWLDIGAIFQGSTPTHFVFTPKIDHFNPDLIVSVYYLDSGGDSLNPWETVRFYDSLLARPAGSGLLGLMNPSAPLAVFGLGPGAATGGSGTNSRIHRQVLTREASVIGHPFASLPTLVNGNDWPGLPAFGPAADGGALKGLSTDAKNDLGSSGVTGGDSVVVPAANAAPPASVAGNNIPALSAQGVGNGLRNARTPITMFAPMAGVTGAQAEAVFDGIDTVAAVINGINFVQSIQDKIDAIKTKLDRVRDLMMSSGDSFAAGVPGFTIEIGNLLCPNSTVSYFPYYLSQLDMIGWHFAIPEMFYPQALVPGWDEIGNFPWYTWGSLYPRAGSLGTKNIDQAGAVFAQRAANIVTRPGQPHIYAYAPGPVADSFGSQINGETKWQMLAPRVENFCTSFGTDPDYPPTFRAPDANDKGNFAYTLWRHYSCCSGSGDTYVGTLIGGIAGGVLDAIGAQNIPPFCPVGLLTGLFE